LELKSNEEYGRRNEDFKCHDPVNPDDEYPTDESLKKLKCLYKKIVTCGIPDEQTSCDAHES